MSILHDVLTGLDEAEKPAPGIERFGRAQLYNLAIFNSGAKSDTDWLVQDWIVSNQITLTAGPEKSGKTTQALQRAGAITTGKPFLGRYDVRQGKALLVTEMDPDLTHKLISDDQVLIDHEHFRVAFLDECEPKDRIEWVRDMCQWQPDYLILDPVDECLGLTGDQVKNSGDVGPAVASLRPLARAGIAIEALYHKNRAGAVANSYKFTAAVDHIFELAGEPGDLTVRYRGRLRAMPKTRSVKGDGLDGYEVQDTGPGRPNTDASVKVRQCLHDAMKPLLPHEIIKATGLDKQEVYNALDYGKKKGKLTRTADGHWHPTDGSAGLRAAFADDRDDTD